MQQPGMRNAGVAGIEEIIGDLNRIATKGGADGPA
jgi:hypothetical protein